MQSMIALKKLTDRTAERKTDDSPASRGDESSQRAVSISGRAMLKQRLSDIIGAGSGFPAPAGRQALTAADKQLLSDVYIWAAEQGADLAHVDTLGRDLASYRAGLQGADGKATARPASGAGPAIAPTASRGGTALHKLLQSDALGSTRLDAGFVRHLAEKGQGSHSPLQLAFVEKVIHRFSADGGKAQSLGREFAIDGQARNGKRDALTDADSGVGEGSSAARRKPMTLESLRADRMAALMKALGARSLSSLWDNLLGRRPSRPS
jgi:hypothetical protein